MIIEITLGILLAVLLLATIEIWLPVLLGFTAVVVGIVILVVAVVVIGV